MVEHCICASKGGDNFVLAPLRLKRVFEPQISRLDAAQTARYLFVESDMSGGREREEECAVSIIIIVIKLCVNRHYYGQVLTIAFTVAPLVLSQDDPVLDVPRHDC